MKIFKMDECESRTETGTIAKRIYLKLDDWEINIIQTDIVMLQPSGDKIM